MNSFPSNCIRLFGAAVLAVFAGADEVRAGFLYTGLDVLKGSAEFRTRAGARLDFDGLPATPATPPANSVGTWPHWTNASPPQTDGTLRSPHAEKRNAPPRDNLTGDSSIHERINWWRLGIDGAAVGSNFNVASSSFHHDGSHSASLIVPAGASAPTYSDRHALRWSPAADPRDFGPVGNGRSEARGPGIKLRSWDGPNPDESSLSFGGRIDRHDTVPGHAEGPIYHWDSGDWRCQFVPQHPGHSVVCAPTRGDDEWWHRRPPDECPEFHVPAWDCDHHEHRPRHCHRGHRHHHCGHHCHGGDHCHPVPAPSSLMLSAWGLSFAGMTGLIRRRRVRR